MSIFRRRRLENWLYTVRTAMETVQFIGGRYTGWIADAGASSC